MLLVLSAVVYALDVKNKNAGEQIETFSKQVLEETGQMYRDAVDEMKTVVDNIPVDSVVDSRMQQKEDDETARFERFRKQAMTETEQIYRSAVDCVKAAQDQKTIDSVRFSFTDDFGEYLMSLPKRYPAAEPGTFSPEVWAAHEIYKLRLAQFDSVMSEIYQSLPWDADENEAAESR